MTAINQLNTTTVDTYNSLGLTVQTKWSKYVYEEAQRKMFWAQFEGAEGSGMPVIRKDDFTKEALDTIKITSIKQLTGSGVTGSSTLQGNEEQLSLVQGSLTVDWVRYAVATDRRTAKRSFLDILPTSSGLLANKMALGMDNAIFTAFGTATTALYAGDASSTATLDASDILSTTTLNKIKTYMGNSKATPLQMSNGKSYYGIVIHENDAYNLRQDPVWNQAQRDANVRGETNPIFDGSMGVYNGMIIFVNNGVSNSSSKSKCIAFGGESIFRGYGLMPQFQTQSADYNFQQGVAIEAIYGSKLNNDVNTNFAVIETYAADPNA